jgi:hypothetical protein
MERVAGESCFLKPLRIRESLGWIVVVLEMWLWSRKLAIVCKLNQGLHGLVPAAHAARDASRMSDAPTSDRISVEGGATAHFSGN